MRVPSLNRPTARAFTLVELVVVLVIVGVLAAVAFPSINSATATSNDVEVKASLNAALDATSTTQARSAASTTLETYEQGLRPVAPDISSEQLRSLIPSLVLTPTGSDPSPNSKTVSIASRWLQDRGYWRVGVASLAATEDSDSEAFCWMAWRDIDPPRTQTDRVANGPVLESYFTAPPGSPQDCTGQAATFAEIPEAALNEGSTLGTSWKSPIALNAAPVTTTPTSGTQIEYPVTNFTQTADGTPQVLTPVVSNPPTGSRFSLAGDLPVYADGSAALAFNDLTGEFTSPGVWPYLMHDVDTNGDTTCAISEDRQELACWGTGVGSPVPENLSTIRSGTASLMDSVSVGTTASGTFACVLFADSKVRCIGDGPNGELGNGQVNSSATLDTTPAQVLNPDGSGSLSGVGAIHAGYQYVCAVMLTATVNCWGSALPAGIPTSSSLPVEVQGLPQVTSLSVGKDLNPTTCAVSLNSRLLCWGSNLNGKAGVGSTDPTVPSPAEVLVFPAGCAWDEDGGNGVTTCGPEYYGGELSTPLSSVTFVVTGPSFTCAVVRSGVKCWGDSSSPVLAGVTAPPGTGNVITANEYVTGLPPASSVAKLSAGSAHACLVANSSATSCWGSANAGALGSGTTSGTIAPPAAVLKDTGSNLSGVSEITSNQQTTCALDGSSYLWCWGTSASGATGSTATQDVAFNPALSGEITGFPAQLRVSVLDSSGFPVASTGVTLTRP